MQFIWSYSMYFIDKSSVMSKISIWTQFLSSLYETIHLGMILSSPSQESHFVWCFSGAGKGASHTYVIHTENCTFLTFDA